MHYYTLPTSWLYSFSTNCSFGFGKICVDKHIQLRQVQKIQDQSNFIWFCIGCLLPCSDGQKEKLKLLTIAYFVEKVSWIWIRYLKLPAKCFRSCIRHFTNLSSRETLASKEWILGRTRKTLVNNCVLSQITEKFSVFAKTGTNYPAMFLQENCSPCFIFHLC